jgi:hypothetical protein
MAEAVQVKLFNSHGLSSSSTRGGKALLSGSGNQFAKFVIFW